MTTARLTFREKAGSVCWQKQLRDKFLSEGSPFVEPPSLKDAIVRPVSRRLAEQVILKYEWLGAMANTRFHYGLFFGSWCAGVCCYVAGGGNAGIHAHKQYRVLPHELGTLSRGACVHWAPPGANSKLVSWSAKMFLENTQCKLVVAYSDTDAGEIGTIYQACNWIYIGPGKANSEWVSPRGRVMNRILSDDLRKQHGGSSKDFRELLKLNGWYEQISNPKHRYVYTRDKALKEFLQKLKKPYPKRPSSIESDAPTVQVGEGSARLTGGLQNHSQDVT